MDQQDYLKISSVSWQAQVFKLDSYIYSIQLVVQEHVDTSNRTWQPSLLVKKENRNQLYILYIEMYAWVPNKRPPSSFWFFSTPLTPIHNAYLDPQFIYNIQMLILYSFLNI